MDATLAYSRVTARSGQQWASIVELLRSRAQSEGDRTLYTFLSDSPAPENSLTFAELDRRACAIGARLQEAGAAGQRVLLLFPPGLDYIAAFFGCLYAEAVAVPAYPPRQNRNLERLGTVIHDARPIVALTTQAVLSQIEPWLREAPQLKAIQWIAVDSIGVSWAAQWQQPTVDSETLAFIQYTSGSTSQPKGVMITHGNLLHNERLIQQAFGQTSESIIVGWLPLFHDMGLIGNVLQPLYVGAQCVLLSPVAFLQKPFRWLETISNYRATTSGGPNFAYDFCVRKINAEQRESLDLSSWTIAFNGSEPVRRETLDRFCAAFGPSGFRREAFFPCYGLAEATLFVTGGPTTGRPAIKAFKRGALEQNSVVAAASDETDVRSLVSSGEGSAEQTIRIVDPETLVECGTGRVGEIWVSGPSVAQGYWNKPDETSGVFQARLSGSGERTYLRTGDLGFLDGEQLFITGRLKDLIIIRGRNCYPDDIEHSLAQCNPNLRPGEAAAFSIEVAGEERLVVVHEVTKDCRVEALGSAIEKLREVVTQQHDLQLYAVVLIKPGTMLKTSSGKIRRQAMKAAFVKGKLDVVLQWQISSGASEQGAACELDASVKEWIVSAAATMLGLERSRIDVNEPLARYGLDSLAATELAHSVELEFGVSADGILFLQDATIAELAGYVIEQRERASQGPPDVSVSRVQRQAFPLSPGQAALWFLHRLAPQSASYNVAGAARIRGSVNKSALRSAFQSLIERHAELRVTFTTGEDGEAVQMVHEDASVSWREESSVGWTEEKFKQRLREETQRPFDLQNGPVFRVTLFAGAEGDQLLVIAAHHIVVDLWSLAILVKELGALYTAAVGGAAASLSAVEVTYQDYVHSLQQKLEGPRGARLLEYWKRQLCGELPILNLNTDRPRPSIQTYEGASCSVAVTRDVVLGLQTLARHNLTTLYTVLLAAYFTLLHRHTGQDELIVGTPTNGRTDRRYQGLVGYLVNPVPVRATLNGATTFRQFVAQLKRTVLEAFEHQEYPFPLLVNNVCPDRDPSRSPMFQTTFVFEQAPAFSDPSLAAFVLGEEGACLELGSLALESVKIGQEIAQFDLSLVVAPVGDELTITLQYNKDLFDGWTVERMVERLRLLLERVVENDETRLWDIDLLTQAERKQLQGFNDTRVEFPADVCLPQMFERQAAATPEATALLGETDSLSYRELNQRANRLAHYLRKRGVGPESRVGILLPRSMEMMVALLAVHKAGGTYLPLDPVYPAERLTMMLEDAAATVVLTEQLLAQAAELLAAESESNPEPLARPENLSHIIYTSGSTGRPKGVAIEHGSVTNFLHWAHQNFSRAELSGVLFGTSICFDLSVFEMFAPLTCGGSVIVADDALHLATHKAGALVTLINTVPSAMTELMRLKAVGAGVQTVNLAGEALQGKLVQQLYAETKVRRVLNLYGPTEYTTYTTGIELERGSRRQPTIGRAIANTLVYIVDQSGGPAPLGVVGEVCVGGAGLARGYWQRAGLTAERFIPDNLSGLSGLSGGGNGGRLYRTGDLGRYLENGEIEYLGRKDHQVKIRGYRIELGEIEAVLLRYPGIKEAAVIAREDQPGDKRIVSYVAIEPGQTISHDELRDYLHKSLPDYMVPQVFITLAAMPLTRNGKIDRKSLPAPAATETFGEGVKARTPAEELVAGIWSEVLNLKDVGSTDNFFDIGGHSLKAVQVTARLAERLQVELPVTVLFEAPTVQRLAVIVEQALNFPRDVARSPIEPASRDGQVPLSFAQQRLWFLQQLDPASAAYNISFSVNFSGPLNAHALEQSIDEIVRRHEALRTTFAAIDGVPVQIIAPKLRVLLPVADLSHLSETTKEVLAAQLSREEAGRPFDLERGPLARVKLIRFREQASRLDMSLHHIVCDGWSMTKLGAEIRALYESFSTGRPSPLPELPIQYADFAQWQRRRLEEGALEKDLAYWRNQLAGAQATIDLPTDGPRSHGRAHAAARVRHTLSRSLQEELNALSRREGVTLYMLLLSSFYSLLARYSQQSDICVGTPIANRSRAECDALIGFFVNTTVLRADLSGDPSFRTVLHQIRERSLAAYAHQDLPFERLVAELRPERSISQAPLFQVVFSFENAAPAPFEFQRLRAVVTEAETATAKFDLMLTIRETENGLSIVFEYARDLFNAATVEQMAAHFERLLTGVIADPDGRLSTLPLLSAAEEKQLAHWAATYSFYPRDKSLPKLFEAQVARTPDAIAVTYDTQQLTYAQLNHRANQLARYLLANGVKPESMIGIMMDRSLEVVIALLATIKAGAVYVPLDPAYPESRIAFMLSETRPVTVLTADTDWTTKYAGYSGANLDLAISPQQLAYVMYTSGSTGLPKGVAISHQNIVRLVIDSTYAKLDQDEVLLQYAPLSFDAATFELWGTLLNGGRLAMMKAGRASLRELGAEIRRQQVSTLWLTSSVFHLMVEEQLDDLRGVRQMLAGGDVLGAADVRRMLSHNKDSIVVNGYGPTESTTFTCCNKLTALEEIGPTVPIGKPIGGTQVYVLDRQMQPAPLGAAGELYIGGDGLARGYWQQAPLTADRFVPNPHETGGARLYRTGDKVRWLRDGALEFLGRIDQQVKIRGHRIELGEIEAVLAQHAAVREAAVVAREDDVRGKRLVAYVVAEGGAPVVELRAYLREQLPEYMVPSAFVLLPQLPLTINGKLDRDALAPPDDTREESTAAYVAPRTGIEKRVAEIFCEVLRLDQVGVFDNFFDLGGHSLLATQVISRVRQVFNIELPLSALFEAPSAAGLSERVAAAGTEALEATTVRRLPLSFGQQRLWFLQRLEPGSTTYNISISARLTGALNWPGLEASINEIVRRHDSLRTTFSEDDSGPVQVIAPKLMLSPPIVDLRRLPETERKEQTRRLIVEELHRPFDLEAGPLLRMNLLWLGPAEYMLSMSQHHTVSDGWSANLFIHEMMAHYEAFSEGLPSPLPPLESQYGDYVLWQREWFQTEAIESQLSYWKQQLAGPLPVLEIPTDRPRPAVLSDRGAIVEFKWPKELIAKVKALGQRKGLTPFMTFLAVYQVFLARYSGQSEVVVGSPVANRNRAEVEPLIGNFVNMMVLRTDLSGNPTFRELLQRVRNVAIGAYKNQDVPFEKLVSEVHAERDLSRTPLFQAMLIMHRHPVASLKLKGVELQVQEPHNGTAKFDLTLALTDTADGFDGFFEYSTDLFEVSTVERMVERLRLLLERVVENDETRLWEIDLLTQAERKQLQGFNDTRVAFPADVCVPQMFERQAAATPEATALLGETDSLSYRELNQRANRLAHYLRKLGVGPESRVGILLPRSMEMMVALLAVHKAGGTYLPLDPVYPAERLTMMLEDAAATVVLTEQLLAQAAELIAAESESNPEPLARPENLSHLIYTSGSTGRPKGVAIEHGSVTNFLHWAHQNFSRAELSGVLFGTSICFDLSVFEMFAPLTCGGSVIVADDALHLATHKAGALVTLINTVPSAMTELLRLKAVGAGVQTVNLAGEALQGKLVQQLYAETKVRRVLNLYGPTEYTTYTTGIELERGSRRQPTIGRAIANTAVYIMDQSGGPAPLGVVGEVCVGGLGLARGYWQRAALTAERFIPDNLSGLSGLSGGGSGGRLYRTGDLGRYLENGEIEYLGRKDHQVKIRGYRIELGEIEAVLGTYPGVETAAVVARQDESGHKYLACYIVGSELANTTDLRRYLQTKLPGYMVPATLTRLEQLHLTPNGKIDRKSLPEPTRGSDGKAYVAPRTHVEKVLAEIFCEVLRLDQVSIFDNFFDLGGHSLLATQVITRIRKALNLDLPVAALFEAHSVAALGERVDAERVALGMVVSPVRRVGRERHLPLSYAQQRLWFLQRLDPSSTSYNISISARLIGALNWPALHDSLNEIVRRHESLRTTFRQSDVGPIQVVAPQLTLVPSIVNLQHLPETERESQMQRLIAEDPRRPFDLEAGPLMRLNILLLGPAEWVLTISLHHTISDGWSSNIFIRELMAHYEAFLGGRPSPLTQLEIQYGDFAVWQRQLFETDVLEPQLSYWKQQLSGPLPVLELPTDHPRPAVRSERGAVVEFKLSRELVERVKSLGHREGSTPFMTFTAACQLLLARFSGQTEVLVGTPVANRNHAEIEPVIGNFVNMLVLRTDLSGNPTFRELVERVRKVAIEAYTHQDVPFEKLVSELHAERDLSRTPLFQAMVILQEASLSGLRLKGIELQPMERHNGTAKFDLSVFLLEHENGIDGYCEYSTDLFEASTIERMMDHFRLLLERVAQDDEQRLWDIDLLTQAEREQLDEFNDTGVEFPAGVWLPELFERQVRETPAAVALVFEDQRFTYAELNQRANQLAHYLRARGVGTEARVGVLLERSPEMVVSLLAILKTGAAYVPLDPDYPADWLAFMLSDAEVAVLLTETRFRPDLNAVPCEVTRQVICLDTEWQQITSHSGEDPASDISGDNLSYVIYTSGSTGRPKGAMNTHAAIYNRLLWMQQAYQLTAADRILQKTPFSFDVSVWEFFWPLMTGARLVLARPGGHRDSDYLVDLIKREEITTLHFVPPMLQIFLLEEGVEACTSLRRVVCSGEALSRELQDRFFARLPRVELHNLYGPTEAAVDVTAWACDPAGQNVPIGRPIANTRIYILDRYQRAVPPGVPGELYIGGVQLARGYHKRPALTAERFVPDCFSGTVAARLYRTGDLARHLSDGSIEYLGRLDHQVKIRGFRIEPSEIEAILGAYPGVEAAAVVIRTEDSGHRYLAGYVVGELVNLHELRRYLQTKLPSYMVPATLTRLEQLHLTLNGKLDRRRLPEPTRESDSDSFIAPRTRMEKLLAEIWQQVLKVDRVSVNDNFFDLGGDSILSVHVVTQARREGLIVTPRQFFQQQTLAKLALVAEEMGTLANWTTSNGHERRPDIEGLPLTDKTNVEEVSPLTAFQQGMLFHVLDAPEAGMYLSQQRYTVRGELDLAAFRKAFETVMDRHQILRTGFILSPQRGPLQVVYRQLTLPWTTHDWTGVPQAEQTSRLDTLLQNDYESGFELSQAPLLRIAIVRREPDLYEFIWSFHLLLMDGWSVAVIFNELVALYHGLRTGRAATLEPPVRYSDYIAWLQRLPQGQAETFWRETLAGFTAPTPVGFDRTPLASAGEPQGYKEKTLVLEHSSTEALGSFAAQNRLTLNTLVQGAWAMLLSRRSGGDDVVFGSAVSGRSAEFPGIESVVGVFLNTLPARIRVPSTGSVTGWLQEIQTQQVEARRFEYCSLVSIQGWSEVPRREPLFNSVVIFQNIQSDKAAVEAQGLEVVGINVTERTNVPLALVVEPETQLRFRLVYQTSRFDDATIDRILENLQKNLVELTTNADINPSPSYQADAERKSLIDSFNQSLATF